MVHFSGTTTYRPVLTLYTVQILGLIFGWENEGIWTSFLPGNCSCISELDVRLLNHLKWTSTAQVMVHSIPEIAVG